MHNKTRVLLVDDFFPNAYITMRLIVLLLCFVCTQHRPLECAVCSECEMILHLMPICSIILYYYLLNLLFCPLVQMTAYKFKVDSKWSIERGKKRTRALNMFICPRRYQELSIRNAINAMPSTMLRCSAGAKLVVVDRAQRWSDVRHMWRPFT